MIPSTHTHLGCKMVAARGFGGGWRGRSTCKSMVGARGFEPRTSSLSGRLTPFWRVLPEGLSSSKSRISARRESRSSHACPAAAGFVSWEALKEAKAVSSMPARCRIRPVAGGRSNASCRQRDGHQVTTQAHTSPPCLHGRRASAWLTSSGLLPREGREVLHPSPKGFTSLEQLVRL
jgi:hypothetical protein